MARFTFKGRRPGETYYVPHAKGGGIVLTHPVDGGANLTDAQLAYFREEGYEVVAVGEAPVEILDAQKQIQDQAAAKAHAEAVLAGASAGEYGEAPKSLKSFMDIAAGKPTSGASGAVAVGKEGLTHTVDDNAVTAIVPEAPKKEPAFKGKS